MTRKEIMTKGHEIAKQLEGDYAARISEGLKQAWEISKNNEVTTSSVLTEQQIQELKNAGLTKNQISERINQVELLDDSRTRGLDFWSKYGKVRLYYTISGSNKNNKGFIDLVNGTIQASKPSMYAAVNEINKKANFEVK